MILVVDDNRVQAITRKAILAHAGFDVQTACSAEDAFQAIENDSQHAISLVITDHVMPGKSGSHFIRLLWERRAGLPVIVLSGLPEAENEYRGLDVTFRTKPIPPEDLIALTHQLYDS